MSSLTLLLILLIFIVFYAYCGYGLLLTFLVQWMPSKKKLQTSFVEWPAITLVIPSFNELYIIEKKMQNILSLDYPAQKLHILWVTDGSDDGSEAYLAQHYPQVTVLHEKERKGKSSAVNRALENAPTEIIVFCDANTMLNRDALKHLIQPFSNPLVGAVSGEKRVLSEQQGVGTGEGLYWKYESWLKSLNARFYSVIGAPGELYAIRKSLADKLPPDTINDDFVLSMNIAFKGYTIDYVPEAYAMEEPSANEKEELKRKIRIAAGSFQTLFRYKHWLNPFRYPLLTFQYFSHKVTRWLLVPIALLVLLPLNFLLLLLNPQNLPFNILFYSQVIFYSMALMNLIFNKLPKAFYLPYYFVLTNYAQCVGFLRFLFKKQSPLWEKVKRKH